MIFSGSTAAVFTRVCVMAWSTERTSDLIDLHEDQPCLFNSKHKKYFNRDRRSKALSEIAAALDFPGI